MFGIYRKSAEKKIAGVLSGIAYRFDIDVTKLRIAYLLLFFFFTPVTVLAYIILAFILPIDYSKTKRCIRAKKVKDWSIF